MKQTHKPLSARPAGFAIVLLTAGLLVTFPQSGYAGKGGSYWSDRKMTPAEHRMD